MTVKSINTVAIETEVTKVLKTADKTLNDVAVLENDDHLLMALLANEIWQIDFFVLCQGDETAEIDDPIAGVADQHTRVEGEDIYIGKYNKIVALAATGYNMGYAKLASPSLRRVFNPFIQPIMSRTA
ncbi:unnamed protein product, partial [marine sediment metagenome]